MKTKNSAIAVGLMSLFAPLALGPKVSLAVKTAANTDENFSVTNLPTIPATDSSFSMAANYAEAIKIARQRHSEAQMKDGIFTFSPDGQLQWIGTRPDLEKAKEEVIRARLKNLYAKDATPTTEC